MASWVKEFQGIRGKEFYLSTLFTPWIRLFCEQAGGLITATDVGGETLGHDLSVLDADGFVKVFLNIS